MFSLETLMGMNRQGIPTDAGLDPNDPMLQAAMVNDQAAMMEGMGMPPLEDPYAMAGMEAPYGQDPSATLTRDMLGGPPPQMSQPEINALAQALGIGTQNADPMVDPMYSPQFDIMTLLGGR